MKPKSRSLKRTLLLLFVIGPFSITLCCAVLSFRALSSFTTNGADAAIRDNMQRFSQDMQTAMSTLNSVVYQFTDGFIWNAIVELDYTEEPYLKTRLLKQIREQIELISFTHDDIYFISYYDKDEQKYLHATKTVRDDVRFDSFPVLAVRNQLIYGAPHDSIAKYYDTCPVLSLSKRVAYTKNELYIYIETRFDSANSDYRTSLFEHQDFFLLVDKNDQVLYSERGETVARGTQIAKDDPALGDYYLYEDDSAGAFSVVYLVPKAEYNGELFVWVGQIICLLLFFIVFATVTMVLLWRTIMRPINLAEEEIKWISAGNLDTVPSHTGVMEFDRLVDEIIAMKNRLSQYIRQEREHEAREATLEVERLLYQINPHFLMNSLNTIYWMATLNGQPEIGRTVQALNKLLVYNLKRDAIMVPLRDEVEALRQYLTLQRSRYDFIFNIRIEGDETLLDCPVPRFILQPLAENSIYHGLPEGNGRIDVTVRGREELQIILQDNGSGIPSALLNRLRETQDTGKGKGDERMGIGINYVVKILENRYGRHASLVIDSTSQTGTRIEIHLPTSTDD